MSMIVAISRRLARLRGGVSASATITNPSGLEAAILNMGSGTAAGVSVSPNTAMQVAAVNACVRIISGAVANLPIHIKRRVDSNTREDLADHPVWTLLRRRPNSWQTPSQFRRMMQANLLMRGNAYAMIVRSRGRVIDLVPLDPARMQVKQQDDLSLVYEYRRKNGGLVILQQSEVMHLVGLTLDGVHGVSPLTYARETIGLAVAQERHGAGIFKNQARPSAVLQHPERLSAEARNFLQESMAEYRAGGSAEGKTLILEEGMSMQPLGMTSQDAQWIEGRKFSRSDIAMFFGVPPHMIGDTEKSTSWGSGIEQQSIGFVTYTLEDHLTAWEEAINRDLIDRPDEYARFNRAALVRGDIKTRKEYYTAMLQWGVMSPDEVRRLEDMNPRDGGDVYYDPPNTAGAPGGQADGGATQ